MSKKTAQCEKAEPPRRCSGARAHLAEVREGRGLPGLVRVLHVREELLEVRVRAQPREDVRGLAIVAVLEHGRQDLASSLIEEKEMKTNMY